MGRKMFKPMNGILLSYEQKV